MSPEPGSQRPYPQELPTFQIPGDTSEAVNKLNREQTREILPDFQLAYTDGLLRYVELTQRIRTVQAHGGGLAAILEIDRERVVQHRILDELAVKIGKTPQDVLLDRILEEGSLREYGIEAPVIKLPFRAYMYFYDSQNSRIVFNDRNRSRKMTPDCNQDIRGISPNGADTEIPFGSMVDETVRITSTVFGHFGEFKKNGNIDITDKWSKAKYVAIIYTARAVNTKTWSTIYEFPLTELRGIRMRNLAQDFDLFLYTTWETLTHREADENWQMNGVEVPAGRLEEITQAMARNPELYWLTESELSRA